MKNEKTCRICYGSDENDNDGNIWYIEYPEMQIDGNNLTNVTFYTSLVFYSLGDSASEHFSFSIKSINDNWNSSINSSQSFLYYDESQLSDSNVKNLEINITDFISGFSGTPFNIRLHVQNFKDKDYFEIGSYLIKNTYSYPNNISVNNSSPINIRVNNSSGLVEIKTNTNSVTGYELYFNDNTLFKNFLNPDSYITFAPNDKYTVLTMLPNPKTGFPIEDVSFTDEIGNEIKCEIEYVNK